MRHVVWVAPLLMIAAGSSNYFGAALAVGLFDVFPPWIVAWMRMTAAGVILCVLFRPKLTHFTGRAGLQALIYGVATLGMNAAFYQAIAQLPIGTAVAIEFSGPVVLAAVTSRNVRDWAAVIAAAVGVVVLSGAQWGGSASGVLFALLAAILWATYVVVGAKISGDKDSTWQTMAAGMIMAGVLASPATIAGWPHSQTEMSYWVVLAIALGLGILSAVIPYGMDLIILRVAGPAYFSVLLALLPVTGAVVGALILGQMLSAAEIVGMVLVVVAVLLRTPPAAESQTVEEVEPKQPSA